MLYQGENKKEISFPLGGIGTGCVGLAGNGSLIDIEIKNEPNKGSEGMFTHFAVKAERDGKLLDARALNTDLQPGYMGNFERARYTGYGWGPDRGSMAGFPHFRYGDFEGNFPFAELDFRDDEFPGIVTMKAFNPFIPTNEDDSSIPAAFFEFEICNMEQERIDYALAFSCNNYYTHANAEHTYGKADGIHYIYLDNAEEHETTLYGNITIATDCPEVSFQEYWYRGRWFDNTAVFWKDFTKSGRLVNRSYETHEGLAPENAVATLAAHVGVMPGERKKIRFVWSWSMPYMRHSWSVSGNGLSEAEIRERQGKKWKNYYAVLFENSRESALYAVRNFARLYEETRNFSDLITRSSLPAEALEAVTANLSVLKSPTCLRLEDGSFYGFEGCHRREGCCDGTCTHVWSYAYAVAFLFPRLERSARTLEYTYSMRPDGGMGFRFQLPVGSGPVEFRPAVDGQFGTVLRVYREYMISGDKEWLKKIWPEVKKSIAYAWSEKNPDKWDRDKDGIMEGRQHHTLDMELFSENSWLSGMYLAGLKAGFRLAEILSDDAAAEEYRAIFESGKKKLNEELFNGEYFCQKVDLKDKERVASFAGNYYDYGQDVVKDYWNEEDGEMKYQIGEGCSIDQVLGQWHADLLHLGEIFEADKVGSALQSVYRYSYIPDMHEHVNPCRIYGLNDESGTVICSYPEGRKKPVIPVPYAEETMHGFEYQAASHMILHGMEEEGLNCVRAIRNRYDGKRRNPWNEMECGSNYARSLASYALLLVYSGFEFDMDRKMIGFHPIHGGKTEFFWSLDGGFGHVDIADGNMSIYVDYGELRIRYIRGAFKGEKQVFCGKIPCGAELRDGEMELKEEVCLKKGDVLEIRE